MRAAIEDGPVTVYRGDALDVLRELPSESVHCVVTSPPYWGLRDYGTAIWEGGDPACGHAVRLDPGVARSGLDGGKSTVGHQREGFRGRCPRCGARRIDSQLGLEATPEEYVEHMVVVFREVRRVLRSDGTLWLNLGDTYAANRGRQVPDSMHCDVGNDLEMSVPPGLKPKDLVGMPWRLAFALQADGWWLRSDIIWAKPNPMPESVTDRPTSAYEHVFLLTKSDRYYYDQEAVREAHTHPEVTRVSTRNEHASAAFFGHPPTNYGRAGNHPAGRNLRNVWEIAEEPIRSKMPDGWASHEGGHGSIHRDGREHGAAGVIRAGRNLRNVWDIPTEPFSGAHFATFPSEIPLRAIKAGTSEHGVCAASGAPWRRVIESEGEGVAERRAKARTDHAPAGSARRDGGTLQHNGHALTPEGGKPRAVLGWEPTCGAPWRRVVEVGYENPGNRSTNGPRSRERVQETAGFGVRLERRARTTRWEAVCEHEAAVVPATVLDPFAGSGTTLAVARRLGRRAIGIELNAEYLPLIRRRIEAAALPLLELIDGFRG